MDNAHLRIGSVIYHQKNITKHTMTNVTVILPHTILPIRITTEPHNAGGIHHAGGTHNPGGIYHPGGHPTPEGTPKRKRRLRDHPTSRTLAEITVTIMLKSTHEDDLSTAILKRKISIDLLYETCPDFGQICALLHRTHTDQNGTTVSITIDPTAPPSSLHITTNDRKAAIFLHHVRILTHVHHHHGNGHLVELI